MSAEGRRILSLFADRPLQENDITRDENGRPYFPDRNADFNISHSGFVCAVSFVSGSNLRTGCDIELVRPRVNMPEIAERYFSPDERNFIFFGDGECNVRFFTVWTIKECYLKLRGLSVFDMPKAPSFISDKGQLVFDGAVSSPFSFYVYELLGPFCEKYLLSAAIEGDSQPMPEIRWFSQSFLSVRSIAEIKAAPSPTETVSPKM